MSWQCFLVKSIRYTEWRSVGKTGHARHMLWTLPDGREVKFDDLPVGAMWHSDLYPREYWGEDRPASLCVVLPGKRIWRMHEPPTDNPNGKWTITGEPPLVTATPSINFTNVYHGHVQNGVVTDDVQGRRFNEDGTREE